MSGDLTIGALEARIRALFADDAAAAAATPLYAIRSGAKEADTTALPPAAAAWAKAIGFSGAVGAFAFAPAPDGGDGVGAALVGLGDQDLETRLGALALTAPERLYALAGSDLDPTKAALAWALGAYRFNRYSDAPRAPARLAAAGADIDRVAAIAAGVWLARDLVNTPAGDLGPATLEVAARGLAETHGARFESIVGDALLTQDYPMIHAVGRAGPEAPRLLDLVWGDAAAPKVTLVGKGVCFDTGGLDIKPPRFMRNMKKDMGGSATALGLAHMIMALKLPVRLRVLIPAVENSVGSDAFRPGDILQSRAGPTVEIGDTDAEGRLVLADALSEASSERPEALIDFATLTGAARVAVGPEIAPFYTDADDLAQAIAEAAESVGDPVWRMPLWDGYESDLSSKVADLQNVSASGYAGSVTAALFLRRFVADPNGWAHFDIFAWNPKTRPGRPEGGEMQAGRAVLEMLERRYARGRS